MFRLVQFFGASCILFLLVPGRESAGQFNASVYDQVKPSIVRITCTSVNRAATGFIWSSSDTAVTAMHVVTGCGNVNVYYEAQGVQKSATVTRVYRKADLALLKIRDAPTIAPLQVEANPPPLTEPLSTLGYPLQTLHMSSTKLELRYGAKTLADIVPQSVAEQLRGGSPGLDLDIDNIEGHLLPGHSGAPIFNQQRRVVAVADGGLENGAVAVSWAVPVKYLNQLSTSTDSLPSPQAQARNVLFSAEAEASDLGQITCSGQTFTKLRSVSYPKASATADDPRGLMQLVTFFAIDPSNITFDVYQHLASGATFVIPAGANLGQAANGDCVASLPSNKVQLHLQLALLQSANEAQMKSTLFERLLAGTNPQQWVADPQWTYQMPVPRFDGMIVRRRAYMHVVRFPVMFQDRYLFETLAVRNNAFIGSAAEYSVSPQFAQLINSCRYSASNPMCADVRVALVDWVSSVLGIQLTTFPIG